MLKLLVRLLTPSLGRCGYFLLIFPCLVFAQQYLPTQGLITDGSASINQSSAALTINQTSDSLSIDWNSYSIGTDHQVTYNQPSSSSTVLNRVTGGQASSILGQINANGRVFLVNPNGIVFAPGAQVDVGSLVASTLDVSLQGTDFVFEGASSAGISNAGVISAAKGGTIGLIAARLENTGTLSAPAGSVVLGAGSRVRLNMGGLVSLEVEQGALDALINQGGAIHADGGLIYLGAKAANAVAQTVINHTGITRARTLATGQDGNIYLMGDMGHDQINVAGHLDASAPEGGDGGFIETSAAQVTLAPKLTVTTLANSGNTGTWLIDPTNIEIVAGTNDSASNWSTSTIKAGTIEAALAGTNVTIVTATSGSDLGNITVNADLSWTAATTLTLNAHNNIIINASLDASGGNGGLALYYGQGTTNGAGSSYAINAPIHLNAGGSFATKPGSSGTLVNHTIITALGAAGSTTGSDLQGLNGSLAGNYVLGADIDASGTSTWNLSGSTYAGFAPIGTSGAKFTGTLNGLGHVISGLTINRSSTDYVGLFGAISNSNLNNIGITGGSITGAKRTGALVGSAALASSISSSFTTAAVSGTKWVGGLVGVMSGAGTLTNAYSTGPVVGTSRTGGLVGQIGTSNLVTNAYATGDVTGQAAVVGTAVSNYLINIFWDTQTTGLSAGGGGLTANGLTTDQMQASTSFSAWGSDISAVGGENTTWRIYEGQTAPLLRVFMQDVTLTASSSRVYDGTTNAVLSNTNFSRAITGLELTSGQFASANAGTSIAITGSYATTGSENLSEAMQRYDFVDDSITGNITTKALSASASANNKIYDSTTKAIGTTLTLSGFVGAETVTAMVTGSSFNDRDAAKATTVTVNTLSLVNGTNGGLASNYSLAAGQTAPAKITHNTYLISYTGDNLMITPHFASVASDNQQNVLCEDIPQLNYMVSDLLNGETLSGALGADVLDLTSAKLAISSVILPNTGLILSNDKALWPNLIAYTGIARPLISQPLACNRQYVSGLML
jgi:filamentous hemagglutinin family protein|tara:strand:+ start:1174 stop:4227 length:3054 start_codon:yes stop_codon:yes gene_type:complete